MNNKQKTDFLKREFDTYYRNMYDTFEVYMDTMRNLVKCCATCFTNYWAGCAKRCKCDKNG